MFEPRLKFETQSKSFKFGLKITKAFETFELEKRIKVAEH